VSSRARAIGLQSPVAAPRRRRLSPTPRHAPRRIHTQRSPQSFTFQTAPASALTCSAVESTIIPDSVRVVNGIVQSRRRRPRRKGPQHTHFRSVLSRAGSAPRERPARLP